MTTGPVPLAGVLQTADRPSTMTHIFDHWLSATGLPGRFVPLTVAPDDIAAAIELLPRIGFVGLNITRPYQHVVLGHADIITDRAALMSGANTLIFRRDGKVHADNTDGYGFIENIRQNAPGWNPKSGPAAVFGAGRAAREVITALLEVGVDEIHLTNRTRPHAEALHSEFGGRIVVCDWARAASTIAGARTIVNATPLGSPGKQEFHLPLDGLRPGSVVSDLAISPRATRLIRIAVDAGCYPVDGIGMALYQAAPAFERWYGVRPEVDAAARAAVVEAWTA
ncbi:MAG: shikimate dehydrogenase [Rhodobacterales bacterium]|nr:MAG: shikimate dehydrogenase [Rhodobacterales bacterium]